MAALQLDALDVALLAALRDNPRAGPLELSRLTKVARATAQARLAKMEEAGVITGYGPDVDLAAAGYPVQAFVTLEIAQGALHEIRADLEAIPGVLEAYATTGAGDVLARDRGAVPRRPAGDAARAEPLAGHRPYDERHRAEHHRGPSHVASTRGRGDE